MLKDRNKGKVKYISQMEDLTLEIFIKAFFKGMENCSMNPVEWLTKDILKRVSFINMAKFTIKILFTKSYSIIQISARLNNKEANVAYNYVTIALKKVLATGSIMKDKLAIIISMETE